MKDLHPKLCNSEVYSLKKNRKNKPHPFINNLRNRDFFLKSYFGKRII